MADEWVPEEVWRSVVRTVPIVSVDLVVRAGGDVVLGRRTNAPAKGEWFVPGGRVRKHERLTEAVDRVAREELGTTVTIRRQLGVYEHHYDVSEFDDVDGKHYVPVAYVVTADDERFVADEQHERIERFTPPVDGADLHPYVEQYLADAGLLTANKGDEG